MAGSCPFFVNDFNLATITFRMQVLGCPYRKYGLDCNQPCNCSNGVNCHGFDGTCLCPKGFESDSCENLNPVLDVKFNQRHIYLPWGSDYDLVCTSHGLTNGDIQWTKNNEKLWAVNTIVPEKYYPKPVKSVHQLQNVTTEHNGVYTCETTNDTSVSLKTTVNINVLEIPTPFIEGPNIQSVLIGDNITITCRVKEPVEIAFWKKGQANSKLFSIINSTNTMFIKNNPDDGLYKLTILNVTLLDESEYRCYFGRDFLDVNLTFAESHVIVNVNPLKPFPSIYKHDSLSTEIKLPVLDIYDVSNGDIINMRCEVNLSKPVVELSWFLDGSPFMESNKYVETDDNLLFNTSIEFLKTATVSDNNRVVTCVAENSIILKENKTVYLNVTYKPVVEIDPESASITEGEDLTFTCSSNSNPMPSSYVWFVNLSNGTKLINQNPVLKFSSVTTDFNNAKLRCEVENSIGKSYADVTNVTVKRIEISLKIILPCSVVAAVVCVAILSLIVYKYRFRIRMMQARQNVYKNREGDKEFDFFIAYKSGGGDEDFVINVLTPKLEEMGFKICVHFKNFLPGSTIIDNITEAVHNSWKTILVLSPAFLESGWCQYEFETALGNMLNQRADILPIIYENVLNLPNLDKNIQSLLKTITYLNWNGGNIDEDQKIRFWKDIEKNAPPRTAGQMADNNNEVQEAVELKEI
ncbi:uncharacterized protein [Antedon mediterranea]|uniref:uncharacterized protein n=1 Tax=Antedon mediterranea TaxID=105859 RepID=UPI003AF54768